MTSSKQQLQLFSSFIPAQDHSNNDLLIFIHGWGMHGDIWSQVISVQSQKYNCLVLDLPGMGRSPMPEGDYSMDYIINLVWQAILPYQKYQLHLVGWSLGAIVAAALVKEKASTFNSLFLVSMGASFVQEDDTKSGMAQDEFALFQALLDEDFEGTLYRFLGLNTKGSQHQRSEIRLLQQLVFSYGIPARKALKAGLNILKEHKLKKYLSQVEIPVKLILGENDALVSVNAKSEFHSGIDILIIERAGHIPFLSHLDAFNQSLSEFVK